MKCFQRNSWHDFPCMIPSSTECCPARQHVGWCCWVGSIEGGQLIPPNQSRSFPQNKYTQIGAGILRLGFSKGFKLANRTSSHQFLLGLFCWELLVRAAGTKQLLPVLCSQFLALHEHSLQGAALEELHTLSFVMLGLTEWNCSLTVLLSVCAGKPGVVASHDCRTCIKWPDVEELS